MFCDMTHINLEKLEHSYHECSNFSKLTYAYFLRFLTEMAETHFSQRFIRGEINSCSFLRAVMSSPCSQRTNRTTIIARTLNIDKIQETVLRILGIRTPFWHKKAKWYFTVSFVVFVRAPTWIRIGTIRRRITF